MNEKFKLSESEYRIVQLIEEGKTNKEIAQALYFTVGTVEQYVSKIFEKTGAKNRVQLALMLNEKNSV